MTSIADMTDAELDRLSWRLELAWWAKACAVSSILTIVVSMFAGYLVGLLVR